MARVRDPGAPRCTSLPTLTSSRRPQRPEGAAVPAPCPRTGHWGTDEVTQVGRGGLDLRAQCRLQSPCVRGHQEELRPAPGPEPARVSPGLCPRVSARAVPTRVRPERPSRSARQPHARTRRGACCGDSAPSSSLPPAQRLGDPGSPRVGRHVYRPSLTTSKSLKPNTCSLYVCAFDHASGARGRTPRLRPSRTHRVPGADGVPGRGGEAWRAGGHPPDVGSPHARPALRGRVGSCSTRRHRKRRVSGTARKRPAEETD